MLKDAGGTESDIYTNRSLFELLIMIKYANSINLNI